MYIESNNQISSTPNRIYKIYEYFNTIQPEYSMSWHQKFKTKTISLDGILSSQTETKKNELRIISLLGSKVLNLQGIAFGDEIWGTFDEWSLPTNIDLSQNSFHQTTVVINNYPRSYAALINNQQFKLVWDLPSDSTTSINLGTRKVYINNKEIQNAWNI